MQFFVIFMCVESRLLTASDFMVQHILSIGAGQDTKNFHKIY